MRLPLVLIGVAWLAGYVVQWSTGVHFMHPVSAAFTSTFLPMIGAVVVYGSARAVVRERRGAGGWREAWDGARRGPLSRNRLTAVLGTALLFAFLFDTFGQWKSSIPELGGFGWDVRLAALDRAIHGGDPWRLLHPWLGRPWITIAIDRLYAAWLPVLVLGVVWQCWQADRVIRDRFVLAFVLTWLGLGVVLAQGFGSAGPCYFAAVTGAPGPYADLFAYLDQVHAATPVIAVAAQRWLWQLHAAGTTTPYTGISAMPSLHVAMPVLFMFASWRRSPFVALASAAYALVIWVGSIQLGWHYAVDGEVSALGVAAIWWVTAVAPLGGRWARNWRRIGLTIHDGKKLFNRYGMAYVAVGRRRNRTSSNAGR